MRKSVLIGLIMATIGFSGCGRILSPEELISPPELNIEKKEVKDAITKFLPLNSELFHFPYAKENRESSFGLKDLDDEGKAEIVAIYRDTTTFKIGILILKNYEGVWGKKESIQLDGTDVTDYLVVDLDGDKKMELVVGYESRYDSSRKMEIFTIENSFVKKIFETSYYSLSTADISGNSGNELVVSSISPKNNYNQVVVYTKYGNAINSQATMIYPKASEPYNVIVGNIESNKKAIFVDLYVNNSYGKSDILIYENNNFHSILEDKGKEVTYQQTPLQSEDVNKDGIIEVGNTSISPIINILKPYEKNKAEENEIKLPVRNYYKYIDDSLIKVKEYFDEPIIGIVIDIPKSMWTKYIATVDYEDGNKVLNVYYSPEKKDLRQNGVLEVREVSKSKKENFQDYQLIYETENNIVIAKLLYNNVGLSGNVLNEYEQIMEDTKDLKEIISQYTF